MPEVICKTVAMQKTSQWPCSMCPIPQFRFVGVRISYIFNISRIPQVLHLVTNPSLAGCGGGLAAPCYIPSVGNLSVHFYQTAISHSRWAKREEQRTRKESQDY